MATGWKRRCSWAELAIRLLVDLQIIGTKYRPHLLKAEKGGLARGCSRPYLVFVKLQFGSLFARDSTVGSALMPTESGQS